MTLKHNQSRQSASPVDECQAEPALVRTVIVNSKQLVSYCVIGFAPLGSLNSSLPFSSLSFGNAGLTCKPG